MRLLDKISAALVGVIPFRLDAPMSIPSISIHMEDMINAFILFNFEGQFVAVISIPQYNQFNVWISCVHLTNRGYRNFVSF